MVASALLCTAAPPMALGSVSEACLLASAKSVPWPAPCRPAGICIYLGIKLTEGPQFTRQLSSSEAF